MRTTSILGATTALFLLIGCGGGGGGGSTGRGEVTGIVFDTDGKPVADATVSVDSGGNRTTRTDASGRYVLGGVADRDLIVHAELLFNGGTDYYGQNLGRVYTGESTPNVNITLYPENELVSLTGQVRDSAGNVVVGARVFARSNDANVVSYSSASALTDRNGLYTIGRLATNVQYQIVSSARGFGDGSATKTIPNNPSSSERTQDLVLSSLTSSAPATPTGLDAIAYTTPGSTTTRGVGSRAQQAAAYAGLKLLRHPRKGGKTGAARDTVNGAPISVDLTWNEYPLNPTVRPAGFIIYRNETPAVDNGYFLQDPLAVLFSDSDVNLVENTAYTYTMKAVSTGFSDTSNVGRSDLSASVSATPLPDLFAQSTGATVSWNAVSGAANYTVYVYRFYPDIFASEGLVYTQSTTGTSLTVSDPDVTAGGTYYYVVVGARADGSAETYSEIGTLRP